MKFILMDWADKTFAPVTSTGKFWEILFFYACERGGGDESVNCVWNTIRWKCPEGGLQQRFWYLCLLPVSAVAMFRYLLVAAFLIYYS